MAQSKQISLAAPSVMIENGFLKYVLPRFSLKTQIRIEQVALEDAAEPSTNLIIVPEQDVSATLGAREADRIVRVFADDAATYAVVQVAGMDGAEHAARLVDWLQSDVGRRTLTAFTIDDVQAYVLPGEGRMAAVDASAEGDPLEGEKLAYFHCGRCHVVGERNRMGGIGSTPSFGALRTIEDWENRFLSFYVLNPHPSFTQVEDVTVPFDPARPPHIAPVELTIEDVEAIAAFAATIPPKDLSGVALDR